MTDHRPQKSIKIHSDMINIFTPYTPIWYDPDPGQDCTIQDT